MLRSFRIILATLCFTALTLLFLDFTGTLHGWLGWLADIQFLPALLALHAGIVVGLILLTLLFGRLYCSVICPLGVMQDLFAWAGRKRKKNRYSYSKAKNGWRYAMLVIFVALLVAGINSLWVIIAPYSAYGRIAQNLLAPVWALGNNALAWIAERFDSYAFYTTEVWVRSGITLTVAIVTLVVVGTLAWRNGRTWCNTICPVGTVLGFFARFSWFRPMIDTSKCNGCKLCARNCKAACIDPAHHAIDYSRCVACMDCLESCHQGAISYRRRTSAPTPKQTTPAHEEKAVDTSRRSFLTGTALLVGTAAARAQEMKADGGLAILTEKKLPNRTTPIVPPGALSVRHLRQHCVACQLCVTACPNGVLRPSSKLEALMQPESSYERGWCRPECTKCADVCPSGAIRPITREEKSSIQIGHAVWISANCIVNTDEVSCGNCARHCPTGAIQMVPQNPDDPESPRIPIVNTERCIGCGSCEYHCPARPFTAIYVEGHTRHRTI